MTWLLVAGAVVAAIVLGAACFGLGFAKGAYTTWTGIQRLNAERAKSQLKAAGVKTPERTLEQLETDAALKVAWALTPLPREACYRVLHAASTRFLVAPYEKANEEKQRIEQEKHQQELLLRAAAVPISQHRVS